jgi:hypothetical protein
MFSFQHKEGGFLGFGFFFSLLKKYDEIKAFNMFSLMLDPKFKTLRRVFTYWS